MVVSAVGVLLRERRDNGFRAWVSAAVPWGCSFCRPGTARIAGLERQLEAAYGEREEARRERDKAEASFDTLRTRLFDTTYAKRRATQAEIAARSQSQQELEERTRETTAKLLRECGSPPLSDQDGPLADATFFEDLAIASLFGLYVVRGEWADCGKAVETAGTEWIYPVMLTRAAELLPGFDSSAE